MALRLTITLKLPIGLPLLNAAASRAILTQEVGAGVFSLVEQIATEARSRTPVNTGILRASIATKVVSGVSSRVLVSGEVFTGQQAPYAPFVEYGRAPGRQPPSGEGSSLRLWVQRVIGDVSRTYLIARAIGRRGIKGRFFMRDALAAVQPRIRPTLQAAVDRAARLLGGR
jgi:hypothetical protein